MIVSALQGPKQRWKMCGSDHRFLIGNFYRFQIYELSANLRHFTNRFCLNSSIRSFMATLGPAGGKRGYAGITGHVSNGLAWYMNGLLIPELWLRRGLTYSFKVS